MPFPGSRYQLNVKNDLAIIEKSGLKQLYSPARAAATAVRFSDSDEVGNRDESDSDCDDKNRVGNEIWEN